MKKRKMPPHIVLPNGMWRFVKAGSKKVKKSTRRAFSISRKKTRVVKMARRFKRKASRRGSMISGAGSLIKPALIGLGAAHLAGYIPVNVPYKEELVGAAAGYLVGGRSIKNAAVGAGAVFLAKMVQQGGSGSVSNNAYGGM